jgi:hypothetical protein
MNVSKKGHVYVRLCLSVLLSVAMALFLAMPTGVARQAFASQGAQTGGAPQKSVQPAVSTAAAIPPPVYHKQDVDGNVYPYMIVKVPTDNYKFSFTQTTVGEATSIPGIAIDWGDGDGTAAYVGVLSPFGLISHTYARAGTYTITIEPGASGFYNTSVAVADIYDTQAVYSPFQNDDCLIGVGGDWSLVYTQGLASAPSQDRVGLFECLFANCPQLSMVYSDFTIAARTSDLTSVGPDFCAYMFYGCSRLSDTANTEFTLPQGLTSVGDDFCRSMFEGVTSDEFVLPTDFNLPQHLTSVGDDFCEAMFEHCSGTSFAMNSVFNLPQTLTSVPRYFCYSMFDNCSGAYFAMNQVFTMPQKLTKAGDDFGATMFSSCSGAAFTMGSNFNLPQELTTVGYGFCLDMFYVCIGSSFDMNQVFALPDTLKTVGSDFCILMFGYCTKGGAFELRAGFNLPTQIQPADPEDIFRGMFYQDSFRLPDYKPGQPYTATLNAWGNDGSMKLRLVDYAGGSDCSVSSGISGVYGSVAGQAPTSGQMTFNVDVTSTANARVDLARASAFSPEDQSHVPGIVYYALPSDFYISNLTAPAAVVMGGPGSVYSTSNDGQGVALSLSKPMVSAPSGQVVTAQGWQWGTSATSDDGSWQAFDPATLMSLQWNGRYLRYYAQTASGVAYSNHVKITVLADSPVYPEVGGGSRVATSAQTALDAWPEGVGTAVFCSGADSYDAAAANYLAGALGCPILLLSSRASANASVKQAVAALGVKKAYTVGAACTRKMVASVGIQDPIRVAPTCDPATVAAKVVDYVVSSGLAASPTRVMLANSCSYADALGVSAYVANKALNIPILFTNGRSSAGRAAAEVKALKTVKTLYVLGSTASVSDKAAKKVKAGYFRVWGTNRNQTAAMAYTVFGAMVSDANASGHINSVGIVAGNNYPDALSAGAAQAHLGGVVMITPPTKVGPYLKYQLLGGGYSIANGQTACYDSSIVKTLTNFSFYGRGIATAVRKAISYYVR